MEARARRRAIAAAMATALAEGLKVEDAVVLHDSNRLALRLLPSDVLVRVAEAVHEASAAFEVEVAQRLDEADAPVAVLDPRVEPRVYLRDGFVVTLWAYYEPLPSHEVAPSDCATALQRLHESMRFIDIPAPHFTNRVLEAQRLVDDGAQTPELADDDRELLTSALTILSQSIVGQDSREQLLHGEPHPGNLLRTKQGLLFIDLQTCCRGPIEFDIAHCGTPWRVDVRTAEAVSANYPSSDVELVRMCWMLMLAMVAAWRWDVRDRFPDGRRMGVECVRELRAALDRWGLDVRV